MILARLAATVAALSLVTLPGAVQAGDWRLAGISRTAVMGFDVETISDAEYRNVWAVVVWETPPRPTETTTYAVMQAEVDCEGRRYRFGQTVSYADGGSSNGSAAGDGLWLPVVPDSMVATFHQSVCETGGDPTGTSTVHEFARVVRELYAEGAI